MSLKKGRTQGSLRDPGPFLASLVDDMRGCLGFGNANASVIAARNFHIQPELSQTGTVRGNKPPPVNQVILQSVQGMKK